MASRRVDRVASLLKQAIGRVIVSELSDPRMGFVTVVRVDPSPDLRTAKVFVSVLGEPGVISRTLHGLRHAARFIRRRIGDEVDLRSVPELNFVEDESVKGQARVSRIIAEAMSEVRPAPAGSAESGEKAPGADLSDEEIEKLLAERKAEEGVEEEVPVEGAEEDVEETDEEDVHADNEDEDGDEDDDEDR